MSQQEMDYREMGHEKAGSSYGGYEGTFGHHISGEKLSIRAEKAAPSATQRLILAIASLLMFMIMTFGLVVVASASAAPPWVIIPIILILGLFSALAIAINFAFNRR